MRSTRALAAASLSIGLAAVATPQPPPSSATPGAVTAIRNARLVTVSGPVIDGGTIVLADGRIAAVGRDVMVPPGAQVVDAGGQWVYPGLLDGLTTLGLVEINSVAGSMDTTEVGDVNPHVRTWVAVHPHSEYLPIARANGVTAALAAPAGGLVSGQSALIRLAGSTPEELTVKAPVAMHAIYPTGRPVFDIARLFEEPELKTFEERVKERRRVQERELRRLGTLLAEAKAAGEGVRAAAAGTIPRPDTDLKMEALAAVARGELPLVIRADEAEDIRAAVKFAGDRGVKMILAGGLEAWRVADVLKAAGVPALIEVLRLPRLESDPYDAPYANAAALHRAGVRFAIVTDSAASSRDLPYQAAMARSYGLPADAALRAITLSPAEIFGVAARMGSLEPGKDANLFLASGDVMDPRTEVSRVFIAGREQSLETRHTRLWQQFKDRK
jgi:imidazolonepropionase-like amidohydrolase